MFERRGGWIDRADSDQILFLLAPREIKDEKQAEIDRKKAIKKERQQKEAEKKRLEEMAQRVSERPEPESRAATRGFASIQGSCLLTPWSLVNRCLQRSCNG